MYDDKFVKRFWMKVDKSGNCWLWIGALTKRNGYGIIKITTHSKELAHRISWKLCHNTEIPKGLSILHKCDCPQCVNPDHLFIGTQKDNVRDMKAKGRAKREWYFAKPIPPGKAKGEQNAKAKLSSDQVLAILSDNRSNVAIAKDYGMSNQQISNIKRRAAWKHMCPDCHDEEHKL